MRGTAILTFDPNGDLDETLSNDLDCQHSAGL